MIQTAPIRQFVDAQLLEFANGRWTGKGTDAEIYLPENSGTLEAANSETF